MLESVPNIESKTFGVGRSLGESPLILQHPAGTCPRSKFLYKGPGQNRPVLKNSQRIQKNTVFGRSPKLVSLYIYLDTISCMQNFLKLRNKAKQKTKPIFKSLQPSH